MSEEELKITLPDGTEISWEDFVKSTPEDDITDEINKDILEKLSKICEIMNVNSDNNCKYEIQTVSEK